jgi:hypothetical protein
MPTQPKPHPGIPRAALLREDLAYHQARILLLVDAVTAAHGHQGKADGLTKLAKLDFLLRYPALPRGARRRRIWLPSHPAKGS